MNRTDLSPDVDIGFAKERVDHVDVVTRMVPEKTIRPSSRFAEPVDVLTTEEKDLKHDVVEMRFAGCDPPPDLAVDVRETLGMGDHTGESTCRFERGEVVGVGDIEGHGNLEQDVLAHG